MVTLTNKNGLYMEITEKSKYLHEINFDSFEPVKQFKIASRLSEVIFFGGALISNQLREDKAVDDYDLMLIGEAEKEKFDLAVKALQENGYEIVGGHGETTTNLCMAQFKKNGKIFELCLKKDSRDGQVFGTFDIDNLYVLIDKDNRIFLKNEEAITSLRSRYSKLIQKTENLYRVCNRMLVSLAKYNVGTFDLYGREFRVSDGDSEQNQAALMQFKRDNLTAKAEFLAKFLTITPRVDNLYEYIEKINTSKLFEIDFPTLAKTLNNEAFKAVVRLETFKTAQQRTLNTDFDVFKVLVCSAEDKLEFVKEFKILKKARSTKQSCISEFLDQLEKIVSMKQTDLEARSALEKFIADKIGIQTTGKTRV